MYITVFQVSNGFCIYIYLDVRISTYILYIRNVIVPVYERVLSTHTRHCEKLMADQSDLSPPPGVFSESHTGTFRLTIAD